MSADVREIATTVMAVIEDVDRLARGIFLVNRDI